MKDLHHAGVNGNMSECAFLAEELDAGNLGDMLPGASVDFGLVLDCRFCEGDNYVWKWKENTRMPPGHC